MAKVTKNNNQIILLGQKNRNPERPPIDINKILTARESFSFASIEPWSTLYVSVPHQNSIYVIDTISNTVSKKLTFQYEPLEIKVVPEVSQLLVTFRDLEGLYLLDPVSNKTLRTYDIKTPKALEVDHSYIYAVVNSPSNSTLYKFEKASSEQIRLPSEKYHHMAFNSVTNNMYISGRILFVVNFPLNETKQVEYNKIGNPEDIVVDRVTNLIYLLGNKPDSTQSRPDSLYVLDGSVGRVLDESSDRVLDIIPLNLSLNSIEVNEKTNQIYISGINESDTSSSGILTILDGSTYKITKKINLGPKPDRLIINEYSNIIYVLDSLTGEIYTVDGNLNALVPATSSLVFETFPHESGDIFCNGKKVNDLNSSYAYNTRLNCEAKPFSNFNFDSWQGYNKSKTNSTTFKVVSDGRVVATFSRAPLTTSLAEDVLNAIKIVGPIVGITGGLLALIKYIKKKRR